MTDTPIERLKGLLAKEGNCPWSAEEVTFIRDNALVLIATIERLPSAGEGERAKAFEEAARAIDERVAFRKRVLAGDPDLERDDGVAVGEDLAHLVRALATLPSEPLPASQEEIEGRARALLDRLDRFVAEIAEPMFVEEREGLRAALSSKEEGRS